MTTHENRIKVLSLFHDKVLNTRDYLQQSHNITSDKFGCLTIATDANSLAFFKGHTEGVLPARDEVSEKLTRVLLSDRNQSKKYLVSDILAIRDVIPFTDGYDYEYCDACEGHGEVDFEFNHKGYVHLHSAECPVCNGTGEINRKPNGEKLYDYNHRVKVGSTDFSIIQLGRLCDAAEIIGTDHIFLTYQNEDAPSKACVFQVGDMEALVMPLSSAYSSHGIVTHHLTPCPA